MAGRRELTALLHPCFLHGQEPLEHGKTADLYPYGLEHLPAGWSLVYPPNPNAGRISELLRRSITRLIGIDLVATLQRWPYIRDADVIYCHDEREYLAAAALLRLTRKTTPFLVAHTLTLFERWTSDRRTKAPIKSMRGLPAWRKRLYRWAFQRVDLFVYNAEPNRELGARLLPDKAHEYVPYGTSAAYRKDGRWLPSRNAAETPLILGVGNDYWRDWETLREAINGLPFEFRLRIASIRPVEGFGSNVVRSTHGVSELYELYRTASCLVIPVRPNAHASGISTILEAVCVGVPIIASRTGGLESYFTENEIAFVTPCDPKSLRQAIVRVLGDGSSAHEAAERARQQLEKESYNSESYWMRVLASVEKAENDALTNLPLVE